MTAGSGGGLYATALEVVGSYASVIKGLAKARAPESVSPIPPARTIDRRTADKEQQVVYPPPRLMPTRERRIRLERSGQTRPPRRARSPRIRQSVKPQGRVVRRQIAKVRGPVNDNAEAGSSGGLAAPDSASRPASAEGDETSREAPGAQAAGVPRTLMRRPKRARTSGRS
jgi:hypothetical protein